MRLGFALPQIGPHTGSEALITVAKGAEELGFDTLWVLDRILWPVDPQSPYPVGDGTLPELYKIVLDPLETLTFVGAHTSRIDLGTSVLNIPFYNPVMLARRLSTIDVLSGGRLRLGLGQGWSPDEFAAAGSVMKDRGKRADEFLEVLKAIWTTDPVEFKGDDDELAQITVSQTVQYAGQHGLAPDRHHGLASCEREWVEAFSPAGR